MNKILDQILWGNTAYDWIISLSIIVGLFILIRLFKIIVVRRVKKWASSTHTKWDNFLVEMVENSAIPLLYISAFCFSLSYLEFSTKVEKVVHVAYLIALTFFILKMTGAAFSKFVHSFIQREQNSESKEKQAGGLIIIANVIIWILGIIFLMDNLGYNVTTLIAGLGVGGITIALAAQTVLAALFSYFVIFLDRPFEIGDFISVSDNVGTIENIGIKTTRLRTLSGEQLICSNTDLTNSRLHTFKRLQKEGLSSPWGLPNRPLMIN